jgi:hypothetical protein
MMLLFGLVPLAFLSFSKQIVISVTAAWVYLDLWPKLSEGRKRHVDIDWTIFLYKWSRPALSSVGSDWNTLPTIIYSTELHRLPRTRIRTLGRGGKTTRG